MNFNIRVVCLLVASLIVAPVLAQGMSGWSDTTVCRLVESDGGAAYVEEASSRGLDCKVPVKSAKAKPTKPKPDEITIFGSPGDTQIPNNTKLQPNDATVSYYYKMNDKIRLMVNRTYKVDPSNNPVEFVKKIEHHKAIDREMMTTTAFSYLYYEDGFVIYDAMPPNGRFSMVLDNSSYFSSHSMGKSITSYKIGHAICEGYIKSIDALIADWPLMKNTLYYGQPLIKLLNMTAGDTNVIKRGEGNFIKTGRNIHGGAAAGGLSAFVKNPQELANTKPINAPRFSYSNLTADVLFNYMMHRVGPDFDTFITNFYQNKIRIKHPIYLAMNPLEGQPNFASTEDQIKQGVGRYGVSATRYDYLRIAKAMMDDWQNDTCEGKYLKSVYDRRVSANRRISSWDKKDRRWGEPDFELASKKYGGQFWSDAAGLSGRSILVMNGANGQTIVMDMDRSRIVVISAGTAHHVNQKKLAYEPIKYGRIR